MKLRLAFAVLTSLLGCLSMAANLTMQVESVFQGTGGWFGNCPLLVTVENKGPNTRGSIVIAGEGTNTYHYPVELPSASKKRVTCYVDLRNSMMGLTVSLNTQAGSISQKFEPRDSNVAIVAGVGDTIGNLQSISQATQGYLNVYAKPEDAPDRLVGYQDMRAVFLTEGAERLHDDQVQALIEYVLKGGTVFFVGSPSSPILKDKRWLPILPIGGYTTHPLRARFGEQMGPIRPSGNFTLLAGRPVAGAQVRMSYSGKPLVIRREFGQGKVVFLGIDPTERPANKWIGTGTFLSEQVKAAGQVVGLEGGLVSPIYSSGSSPFNIKMPDIGTVIFILLLYILLVAPVNILVLRRLRKQELAWITSPVISIVFAGIFFGFASSLYQAGLSRTIRGRVLVDSTYPNAIYQGENQVFASRGGIYDLGVRNVVGTYSADDEFGYYGRGMQTMDIVDTGTIRMDAVELGNLSFRKFPIIQRLPGYGNVVLKVEKLSKTKAVARVTNKTPSPINSASIFTAYGKVIILEIGVGKTVSQEFEIADFYYGGSRPRLSGTLTKDDNIGVRIGNLAESSLNIEVRGDYVGATP